MGAPTDNRFPVRQNRKAEESQTAEALPAQESLHWSSVSRVLPAAPCFQESA